MKRFKFFVNFTKEEKWLNKMAENGYRLTRKFFLYTFEKVKPEKVNIRIDYREFKMNQDFVQYITLFEDSGWKHIAGSKNSGSQYFIKGNEESSEDIFSDNASRAGRHKRALDIWLSILICLIPIAIVIATTSDMSLKNMLNPKVFYYTPNLWEKEGLRFVGAFLFETPFAIIRGYGGVIVLILLLVYAFFATKHWLAYKKALKSE